MTFTRSLFAILALGLLAPGCKTSPFEPPFEKYEPGLFEGAKGKKFPAPDAANTPWRVMAFQEVPRQKKNPHWKTIAASESGMLDMPERSSFKCLYNPVVYRAEASEYAMSVDSWDAIRTVRCSNDGFRTYSEMSHVKTVSGTGAYEPKDEQGEISFFDLIRGKRVRITVLLRAN